MSKFFCALSMTDGLEAPALLDGQNRKYYKGNFKDLGYWFENHKSVLII